MNASRRRLRSKMRHGGGGYCANYENREMRASLLLGLMLAVCAFAETRSIAAEPWLGDAASGRAVESNAIEKIPFARMTPAAQDNIRAVVDRPSFFRRLPTQSFDCDPELFVFLVRYPEVIVNIWDLMEITKVEVKRVAPYVFTGHDGAGTTSRCELLYGTSDTHVYYGTGKYSGSMAPREVNGRCVSVLHSSVATSSSGRTTITVSMDIFLKLDNLGADLLTRTLGPLVGKTADYNFAESAKFVSQVSQVCEKNPLAAQQLAQRLTKCDPSVRERFAQIATRIAADHAQMQPQQVAGNRAADNSSEMKDRNQAVELLTRKADAAPTPKTVPPPQPSTRIKPAATNSSSGQGLIRAAKPPVELQR